MTSGAWWPCFICDAKILCGHREPELVAWMRTAPPIAALPVVAAVAETPSTTVPPAVIPFPVKAAS